MIFFTFTHFYLFHKYPIICLWRFWLYLQAHLYCKDGQLLISERIYHIKRDPSSHEKLTFISVNCSKSSMTRTYEVKFGLCVWERNGGRRDAGQGRHPVEVIFELISEEWWQEEKQSFREQQVQKLRLKRWMCPGKWEKYSVFGRRKDTEWGEWQEWWSRRGLE